MNVQSAQGQQGFTLLEVLVAFTIMALSLSLLYRAMGSSADSAGRTLQRQQVLLLADALLQSRQYVDAKGWQEQGQASGLAWRIESSPLQQSDLPPPNGTAPVRLHRITLTITPLEHPDQSQTLHSIRPERKPLPGESTS